MPVRWTPPGAFRQVAELDHQAIRDTIAAVFGQRAYRRSFQQTLWEQLWEFFWRTIGELLQKFKGSPFAGKVIEVAVLAALVLILVRAIIAVVTGDIVFGGTGGIRTTAGAIADRWAEAQRLAAAGLYTEAAHELYAALLASIARGENLHLHPSKTAGDYVRDLRRRSSALLPPFRDFARSYEVVVYGFGACDRDRYERLYSLASGMIPPAAP